MINPAMFGISQQQMEQAKEVGRHVRMTIRKYRQQGKVEVQFFKVDPNDPTVNLPATVDQVTHQLSWGFANFFDIKGEIYEME